MRYTVVLGALAVALSAAAAQIEIREYPLPPGARPHDVAPAPERDGVVWYTAQTQGALGRLDPKTGKVDHIALGRGSSPQWRDRRTRRRAMDHR